VLAGGLLRDVLLGDVLPSDGLLGDGLLGDGLLGDGLLAEGPSSMPLSIALTSVPLARAGRRKLAP